MKLPKFKQNIRFAMLLFVFLLYIPSGGQAQELSASATLLENKLNELKLNPSDIDLWEQYLSLFPSDKDNFIKLFNPEDFSELYENSFDFIFIFQKAPKSLDSQVIGAIFNIIKNGAPGCCDAWSALHSVLSEEYVTNHYSTFMTLLKGLSNKERRNIITFLADKEAIKTVKSYQKIIDDLRIQNEELLAEEFEEARVKRIAQAH